MTAIRFQEMQAVPGELLQERLETVHELKTSETEMYEVMKDAATGEHYIHYAYLHIHVTEGGAEEMYHHLMPAASDDVIAVVLGEQPYEYPGHWQRAYLRSGQDGSYVWFDPQAGFEAEQYGDDKGAALREKLLQLKREGGVTQQKVAQLFADIDRMWTEEEKE